MPQQKQKQPQPKQPPAKQAEAPAPQALILVAYGADRPGILDEVSQYLYERGGNISESKLLSLHGTFIMMIALSADAAAAGRIREGLSALAAASRVGIDIRDAIPDAPATAVGGTGQHHLYRFTATGSDQAGVLHKLSHLLRALNVNIADVRTQVGLRPSAERPQFDLELLLSVPRDTPVIKLREYVGTLCGELAIEWELGPA